MVNVVNKMCEVHNCFKRPSLNYPGIRPAVRCGEHKLEGMTNAFRKATVPKSSNKQASCNGSQTHTRVKSSDGDTTDSGSDEDESSPVSLESGTGDAASPTAKPAPGQFSRAFLSRHPRPTGVPQQKQPPPRSRRGQVQESQLRERR